MHNISSFHLFHGDEFGWIFRSQHDVIVSEKPDFFRKVIRNDLVKLGERHGMFDCVTELSHVAGPAVAEQFFCCRVGNTGYCLVLPVRYLFDKFSGE